MKNGLKISLLLAVSATVVWSAGAQAQDQQQKYSTWSNPAWQPPQADDRAEKLIKDLRSLIDEAGRARAADPRFLKDLTSLADRYENPWRRVLFRDDFSDGDFTRNPTWTVDSGKFWVESGYGLRSTPALVTVAKKKLSREEKAAALLGAFLTGKRPKEEKTEQPLGHAAINLAVPITNAFSLTMELSSWVSKGQLELGLIFKGAGNNGYRLIYQPGATPVLRLMRVSTYGSGVVISHAGPLVLEDRRTHVIGWTRDKAGEMVVSVDGKELMRGIDRGYQNKFDGLVILNQGGDYVIKSISALGTE